MPKKKQMLSLADLMADEVEEFEGMLEDGYFDYLDEKGACCFDDERNVEIDKEWAQALKDLKELGFMEDDK